MAWLKQLIAPRRIYADYAALTPVAPCVLRAMNEVYMAESVSAANPSALYREGVRAERLVQSARESIARHIHAHADEIIFTSSGTEANNNAILGVVAHAQRMQKGSASAPVHIIVSAIEHSSVLEAARALEQRGVAVDYVPVDAYGIVDVQLLKKMIRPETVLVSVMAANNEIGTVQPIAEIAKLVRHARAQNPAGYPLFHSDACQIAQYVPIRVEGFGPDLITFDAHKMYGPRGIGALWIRRRFKDQCDPIMFGGGQERGLRPGTESVPAIVGFARAFEYVCRDQEAEVARIEELREFFVSGIKKRIMPLVAGAAITGHELERLPHIVHMTLPSIDTEMLVLQLDAWGVACSTKSSCMRDEAESYVVRALGAAGDNYDVESARQRAQHTVRFSIGRATTKKSIVRILNILEKAVAFQIKQKALFS